MSFNKTWAEYRDGFGSESGNDNYWMGLENAYQLALQGSLTLRVEVDADIYSGLSDLNYHLGEWLKYAGSEPTSK